MKDNHFLHVVVLLAIAVIVPSGSKYLARIFNDDRTVMDIHEADAPQTLYVSLDAGFMNGGTNRSSVELIKGSNHLRLRQGDRLYVRAVIKGTFPEKLLAGYLTLTDEVEKKDSKEQFRGALSPYVRDESRNVYVSTRHDFRNLDDPLSECDDVFAIFVERNADNFRVSDEDKRGYYSMHIASSDVETLQKKSLEVFGWYDESARFIALDLDNTMAMAN